MDEEILIKALVALNTLLPENQRIKFDTVCNGLVPDTVKSDSLYVKESS